MLVLIPVVILYRKGPDFIPSQTASVQGTIAQVSATTAGGWKS